jgi:8-oxo-dGTP pyrophosphatase MutT (NUDIX family)
MYQLPGQAAGWASQAYEGLLGLPRPMQTFTSGDFSPLSPILPVPIDIPEEPNGRPRPRRLQPMVGWNLPIGQPGTEGIKLANFAQLRDLAEIPAIGRTCIEIRKADLIVADYDIVPTPAAQAGMQGNPSKKADWESRKGELMEFFANPDPDQYDSGDLWLNALFEDNLVLDAVAIYLQPAGGKGNGPAGSSVGALCLQDASLIKPLMDEWGTRPKQPAVAYQQVLWGVPRVDLMDIINLGPDATIEDYKALNPLLDQLTTTGEEWIGSEMIYFKSNPRTWTPYGMGPTEQGIMAISLMLARQTWQSEWFRNGSLPAVFMDPGESIATPEEARQLMQAINQLGGDLANMHQVIVTPPGAKVSPQKPADLSDDIDTWFTSLIAMPFGLSISDLGITPKLSSMMSPAASKNAATQAADQTTRRSAIPLAKKLKTGLFDPLIRGKFGQTDMAWSWGVMDQGETLSDRITDQVALVKASLTSIDEACIALDLKTYNEPWSMVPLQFLPTGVIPMGQTPPPPPGSGPAPIDANSRPLPPEGGASKPPAPPKPGNKPPALPKPPANGNAPEPDKSTADQGLTAAGDAEPHESASQKEKANELRALRRYLARGKSLESFEPRALRPAALKAAKGEQDPATAALKAAKAQRRLDHRETALAKPRASLMAGLTALVHKLTDHKLKPAQFAPAAIPILAQAYQDAYTAGAGSGAGDWGDAASPPSPESAPALAQTRAMSMMPYLKDLALDVVGGVVAGAVNAPSGAQSTATRVQSYADGLTAPYEQGYIAAAPDADGTNSVIRWTLGDAENCENCLALDGQTFSPADLPGFPGDGDYGQDTLCLGGPACACSLSYEQGDSVLAQTQSPSIARQTTQGTDPAWMSKSRTRATPKDISVGAPLDTGFVPFDLSGPEPGQVAPNNVAERTQRHAYVGSGVRCLQCGKKPAKHPKQWGQQRLDEANAAKAQGPDSEGPAMTTATPQVTCAGALLRAFDSGRVLLLQRANDPSDPCAGMWELPGGHLEAGESPEQGAAREWGEEVGTFLPADAKWLGSWTSGIYQGFVVETAHEASVDVNQGEWREVNNPDGDSFEAVAWFDPNHLAQLPLRPEMMASLPQIMHTLAAPALKSDEESFESLLNRRLPPGYTATKAPAPWPEGQVKPGAYGKADDDDDAADHVYKYLAKHYDKVDLDWVKGCEWQLKPAVALDDIEMAHRPGGRDPARVEEKVEEIKGGKQPKPIVLVAGAGPKMVIADGYYRTEALQKAGHTTSAAWVGTPGSGDADWPQKVRQMQYNTKNHDVPREDVREELPGTK